MLCWPSLFYAREIIAWVVAVFVEMPPHREGARLSSLVMRR